MSSEPITCTGSTTHTWKTVRVRRLPDRADASPKASVGSRARGGDLRKAHWIKVLYRGGPEAWWEIEFLGQTHRAPGHLALDDVLRRVVTGNKRR